MDSSSDYTDYDQFQETMDDEVETQHEEADDIINANDTISDTSQRELRYDHHQTKQKIIHEAMRQADHHQTKQKLIDEAMRQADHHQTKQKIIHEAELDRKTIQERKTSYVWQVFEKFNHDGKAHVKCILCLPLMYKLAYCGSSTSTMNYHIKSRHPSEHDKLQNTALQKNNDKIHSYMRRPAQWKLDGLVFSE